MKFRTGVMKDGRLAGMHLQTLVDGGGYGGYGVASTFYTGALQTVTYELPRYKFEAARVAHQQATCGPKRGHGTPQPRFGQEVQLDKIAEARYGSAELRLKNVLKPNSLTANWLKVGSIGLAECIRRWWKGPIGTVASASCLSAGASDLHAARTSAGRAADLLEQDAPVGVQLLVDRSGQVTAFCGATEIGQAPTTCSRPSSPRCSASIRSTCAASPATPA